MEGSDKGLARDHIKIVWMKNRVSFEPKVG